MTGLLRCGLAIILCATLLGIGGARAADVSAHLVGMARSLTSQIDAADFAASGDPALAQRVDGIIKRARLRSWAGAPPKIAADLAKLAASLDLDLALDGHHAALDRLLAARDSAAQHDALDAILQLTGKHQTLREAGKTFRQALAEQLAPLQKRAKLEAGEGQSIDIEWEPETSSVLARVSLGEGQGEVVLHGGAAGKVVNGELVYDVEADAAPVTRITRAKQAEINSDIFGVWSGSDGARWTIRGGAEIEAAARAKPDPNAQALEQIGSAKQQLAALEKEKVYVWVDSQGGEVIQKKFKKLAPPFRYDRVRSENMHKTEIAALRERIAAAEANLKLPPVKQHDPLRLKDNPTGRVVEIEVQELDGRRYRYDEAAFDGKTLTASRTLRDARDITDLPAWVIEGLIAS